MGEIKESAIQSDKSTLLEKGYLVRGTEIGNVLSGNSNPAMKFFLIGLVNTKTVSGYKEIGKLTKGSYLTTYSGLNDSIAPAITVKEFVDSYKGGGDIFNDDASYVDKFFAILKSLNIQYFNGGVDNTKFSAYPIPADKNDEPLVTTRETIMKNGKEVASNLYYGRMTEGSGYLVENDEEKKLRLEREEKREQRKKIAKSS